MIGTFPRWALAALTLGFLIPCSIGQGTKTPPALIVWSGDKSAGQTWAKLGPKGMLKIAEGAGVGESRRGLVLHMDGDGYRCCGINWKSWFPPDAASDATPYNVLAFHILQVTRSQDADLTVALVDHVKRADGQAASNALSVLGDGGIDKIDGTWRRVVLPLDRFTQNKPLQLARLWEVDFSNQGNNELIFQIDKIGFAVENVEPSRFKPGPAYKANAHLLPDGKPLPIKDGIYGVCGLPREKLTAYRIPITRWGGNPSTRYNWKLGVDNGGSDWFFKNRGKLLDRRADSGYLHHIAINQTFSATTYQTVPMIGWVAKDASSYGFSVARYGPQKATVTGGLAQAEVFGILAREGIDLAFIWHTPEGSQELGWKLFRSYDGKRSGFGDRLLPAASDQEDLAVFVGRRTADEALTVAVINKNLHGPCELALDLGAIAGNLQVYRFDQKSGARVIQVTEQAGAVHGTIKLMIPAASASMLVIKKN